MASYRQLLESGFTRSGLSRAVARGQLVRLNRGVYGVGQAPTDPRAPLLTAALLGGPDAVVASHSASELLGLSPNRTGRIWVAAPGRHPASRRGIEIRGATFGPGEVGTFRGVPCTSPSRTILDLAAVAFPLGEAAVKGAGGVGLLDVEELLGLIEQRPRRRGAARIRAIVLGSPRVPVFTRSELERRLHLLCARYGPELPDMNVEVYAGDRLYECDAVWPQYRLIIECDSHWHDNPVTARADAERDERLTLAGWRVFRMRWAQIALRPARTAATIRHLIATQQRLLASAC